MFFKYPSFSLTKPLFSVSILFRIYAKKWSLYCIFISILSSHYIWKNVIPLHSKNKNPYEKRAIHNTNYNLRGSCAFVDFRKCIQLLSDHVATYVGSSSNNRCMLYSYTDLLSCLFSQIWQV